MSETLTPEQQQRIDQQLSLLAGARTLLPHAPTPYFGHMRVRTAERESDVLLGPVSRVTRELSIIDWQRAPLAEVFFAVGENEPYEVEIGERIVEGTLLQRNVLGFEHGQLVEIIGSAETLTRRGTGSWRALPGDPVPALRLRPESTRRRTTSPIEVELDPAQRRLVDLPARESVLILGEAGFGKTTVALHRLARLRREAGERFRGAVIVPTDGLRRLTEMLLSRLGFEDLEVWHYDRWAATQAHRAFGPLPKRESQFAGAGVIAIKRHPALREVLADLAANPPAPTDEEEEGGHQRGRIRRGELEHLFGDSALLDRVAARSGGAITQNMVKQTLEHTHLQFSQTAAERYAHVHVDALVTADARGIDEGTPEEDAGTIDAEDYAVLFELDRLRARAEGRRPARVAEYDCIVVDEAQELAPIELALISRARAPNGSIIVAGDAAQQVDPTSSFLGWPATLAELGVPRAQTGVLEVSYRCPPDVTALARRLLAAEPAAAMQVGDEPSITRSRLANDLHLVSWLIETLRRLGQEDPAASVAVICRSPGAAQAMARLLEHGVSVRLSLEGRFEFRAGVAVTCVPEVKGLEFDYVLVPDASPGTYPELAEARRALYVALTRTTHVLGLATPDRWSPLVGG